ncbi:MAG: hypothetical protein GXO65_02740 [Euryarchaeota archaeon]|nr:hypothetical protein [Euryarchaeota archaeon]
MNKPLRVVVVSLLFVGFLFVVLEGFDWETKKGGDTTKGRVVRALKEAGIPPSDVLISNGREVKKALNIKGPEPQDTARVALVIYANPPQYTYPEGINKVIFTALSADESLQGVLAFDTTHIGSDPSSRTIIYGSRTKAEELLESGLDTVKIYNQWEAFTVTKLDVASSGEVLAEELSRYELDVKAVGVFNWSEVKGQVPIEEPWLDDDTKVAMVGFIPGDNGTGAPTEALLIMDIAFSTDPSIGAVVVSDLDRLNRTGNVSLYYMGRETYEGITPQTPVEEAAGMMLFKEFPPG